MVSANKSAKRKWLGDYWLSPLDGEMRSRFSPREGNTAARLLRLSLPLPERAAHYITGELLLVGKRRLRQGPSPRQEDKQNKKEGWEWASVEEERKGKSRSGFPTINLWGGGRLTPTKRNILKELHPQRHSRAASQPPSTPISKSNKNRYPKPKELP